MEKVHTAGRDYCCPASGNGGKENHAGGRVEISGGKQSGDTATRITKNVGNGSTGAGPRKGVRLSQEILAHVLTPSPPIWTSPAQRAAQAAAAEVPELKL